MIKFNIKLLVLSFLLLISLRPLQSAEMVDPIKVNWSFKGSASSPALYSLAEEANNSAAIKKRLFILNLFIILPSKCWICATS